MGSFFDIETIKRQYSSGNGDDIVGDFYNPVLKSATSYDRAVGYFSSNVLVTYIAGLEDFVQNHGHLRLVISPFVSSVDERAFLEADSGNITHSITELFDSFKADRRTEIAAKILSVLIVEKVLEVRFVVPKNGRGLYHQKIGFFEDDIGCKIAISGSNNETAAALTENFESFSTYCSWMQGQNDYVNDITSEFDDVWNNENNSNYETLTLSETVGLGVFDTLRTDEGIEQLYKELNSKYETGSDPTEWQLPFKPYDYQVKAAEKWLIEKRGIISFATGTGKTKTAIICMHKFIAKYGPSFFLIIVPDKTLNNQWSDELKELPMNVIQCFSENSDWRGDFSDALEEYRFSKPRSTAIVVTNSTMMKPKFIDMMGRMPENFMLVGDECHHMGTEKMLNCLPNVNYRLGLSATPFVYGNDFLTTQLQTYFGGIIAEYPLSKAILDGRLTRYSYRPIIVGLSDNELTVYRELSHKIAKYEAIRQHQKLSGSEQQQEEMLLFKRARVVYSASEKMHSLKKLLTDPNLVDRLLIYCGVTSASEMSETVSSDDVGMNQLEQVNKMLSEKKIAYAQYTRNEDGQERHNRISDFKQGNIRVMTAIRCLDEGVDIPEITSAIILASSGNPREFIQRRGRLLRLYPGKKLVNIYDMVVLGDDIDSLNKSELTRVREFTEAAENSAELNERFGELFMKYLEEDND